MRDEHWAYIYFYDRQSIVYWEALFELYLYPNSLDPTAKFANKKALKANNTVARVAYSILIAWKTKE